MLLGELLKIPQLKKLASVGSEDKTLVKDEVENLLTKYGLLRHTALYHWKKDDWKLMCFQIVIIVVI